MKTKQKYTMVNRFGGWRHSWVVQSATMAVELNITEYPDSMKIEHSAGFEMHSTKPIEDSRDVPDHVLCECVGYRPCWHDGSSRYAMEHYLPMWTKRYSDHEMFFSMLTSDLKRKLEDYGQQDPPDKCKEAE